MKRLFHISIFWILTSIFSGGLFGQSRVQNARASVYIDDEELVKKVLFLTYDGKYSDALESVDVMIKKKPQSLQWNFFRVMILWRQIWVRSVATGYLDSNLVDEIDTTLGALKKSIDETPKSSQGNRYYLFYAGAIYGYLGIYYVGLKNENLKAINVGKDGLDYHKKLLQLDPSCYDAYYGLGLYNYFASNVPWYLKPFLWVFGMTGSEEKADAYLGLVAERGSLAKCEAMEWLAELYLKTQKVDSAIIVYRRLAQMFPENYYYLLKLGWTYRYAGHADTMADDFEEVIEHSKTVELNEENIDCLRDIYSSLGAYLTRAGRIEEAISLYKDALGRDLPGYHVWSCYFIGRGYEKLGDKTSAIRYYQSIHNNELTLQVAREVRSRLNAMLKDSK